MLRAGSAALGACLVLLPLSGRRQVAVTAPHITSVWVPPSLPRPTATNYTCSVGRLVRRCCRALQLLLWLLSLISCCACVGYRQQHNVWYNGLFVSGIAVDESTGDVFFSDAAANRVVRQSVHGDVLAQYRSAFFSPMQLAYHAGKLYVADSTSSRFGVVDVATGLVNYSVPSPRLSSCSALTVNSATGSVIAVDGWGLQVNMWDSDSQNWTRDNVPALVDPLPSYLASVTVRPSELDNVRMWLSDPTVAGLYSVSLNRTSAASHASGSSRLATTTGSDQLRAQAVDMTALQYRSINETVDGVYLLMQWGVDMPMNVYLIEPGPPLSYISTWTAPGRGGAAIPFYGWAMYVDSNQSMYVSDHGVDEKSKFGRVVKMAPNGTELAQWSMSDGTAYTFTSVWYDDGATAGSCVYWMADSERGLVRVAANGTVLLPFDAAPFDPTDRRGARFTGMARDAAGQSQSTLVLLDTSDATTTKLWRYLPQSQRYELLNSSAARLGPNVTGVAVDEASHAIYVSDSRSHTVIRLFANGTVDHSFDTLDVGFMDPAGLVLRQLEQSLFVADRAYGASGAVVRLDVPTLAYGVLTSTAPPMYRPLSVAIDAANRKLYAADSNGLLFQFDLDTNEQETVHRTVPSATAILSMAVNAKSNLYAVDAYSRRLVILMWAQTGWDFGDECVSTLLPTSSSSSAAAPSDLPSSSGSASAAPRTEWSAALTIVVVVAVIGVVGAAAGGVYVYVRWRRGVGDRSEVSGERLLPEIEQQQGSSDEARVDLQPHTSEAQLDRKSVSAEASRVARDRRLDEYVTRYEMLAAVSDMQQLDLSEQQPSHSILPLLSIVTDKPSQRLSPSSTPVLRRLSAASTSLATSASSHTTSSNASTTSDSSASSTTSQDHLERSAFSTDCALRAAGLPAPVATSRTHIAALHSVLRAAPTFITSVTDLTILGEGSSGVVYRGMYGGLACVVKLPKSVNLTGAAWREWQCHMCLPSHPHLICFLGALPMHATNYLVLSFVRQGSLHTCLASTSASGAWYNRPYGVMRCARDIAAALHHMHTHGIVHRDVSSRNILVDSDGRYVLADLGLATQLATDTVTATAATVVAAEAAVDDHQTAVPIRWTSPEALAWGRHTSESDVWSLGVALWEMTARGRLPYPEQQTTMRCVRPIVQGRLTLYVDERWGRDGSLSEAEWRLADTVRGIIRRCLTHEAEHRPDSQQLLHTVESEWEQWKAEGGDDAEQLERDWVAFHDELQQQLGAPCERTAVSSVLMAAGAANDGGS